MTDRQPEIDRLTEALHDARVQLGRIRQALACPTCGDIMQSRRGEHPALIIEAASQGERWAWVCGLCVARAAREVLPDDGGRWWSQRPEVWAWAQARIEAREKRSTPTPLHRWNR